MDGRVGPQIFLCSLLKYDRGMAFADHTLILRSEKTGGISTANCQRPIRTVERDY